MSFLVQIECKKRFVIPKDSGYTPPDPDQKRTISLSGGQMSLLIKFMAAAGVVDARIYDPKMRKHCRQGRVPGYKFFFNDGRLVTSQEAAMIADALTKEDPLSAEFLKAHFPALLGFLDNPEKQQGMKECDELLRLWVAFNRAAAANAGYTLH